VISCVVSADDVSQSDSQWGKTGLHYSSLIFVYPEVKINLFANSFCPS